MQRRFTGAFLLLLLSGAARAQGNFRATPTGGRSALMGGTGVALGTDGAAPFLNPATLVRIDSLLSVSVNLLSAEVTTVNSFQAPGPIDSGVFGDLNLQRTTITKTGLEVVPSTLCVFLDAPKLGHSQGDQGKQKLGICFGTNERDNFNFIGRGYQGGDGRTTNAVQALARNWSRFVLAPTYAVYLGDDVALGASLQAVGSNASLIVTQSATTYGGNGGVISTNYSSGLDANAFGISPIVGLTIRGRPWTFGLSLQTADLTIYGTSNASEVVQVSGARPFASSYAGEGGFRATAPWRAALGLGREFSWGSMELDASVGIPHETMFDTRTKGTLTVADGPMVAQRMSSLELAERPSALLHTGLGFEWFTSSSRSLSILGGLAGSVTFNPTPGGVLPARQSRFALSLGLGSHGEGGDLLIGAELSYARGNTLSANGYTLPPRPEIVSMDGFRALFVLAGSTSLKAIGRAVKDVVIEPVIHPKEKK